MVGKDSRIFKKSRVDEKAGIFEGSGVGQRSIFPVDENRQSPVGYGSFISRGSVIIENPVCFIVDGASTSIFEGSINFVVDVSDVGEGSFDNKSSRIQDGSKIGDVEVR